VHFEFERELSLCLKGASWWAYCTSTTSYLINLHIQTTFNINLMRELAIRKKSSLTLQCCCCWSPSKRRCSGGGRTKQCLKQSQTLMSSYKRKFQVSQEKNNQIALKSKTFWRTNLFALINQFVNLQAKINIVSLALLNLFDVNKCIC